MKASVASTRQQVKPKPLAPNQRRAMRVGSTASSTSSAASYLIYFDAWKALSPRGWKDAWKALSPRGENDRVAAVA